MGSSYTYFLIHCYECLYSFQHPSLKKDGGIDYCKLCFSSYIIRTFYILSEYKSDKFRIQMTATAHFRVESSCPKILYQTQFIENFSDLNPDPIIKNVFDSSFEFIAPTIKFSYLNPKVVLREGP